MSNDIKKQIDLTMEQLAAYIKGELELGKISSPYDPDGIFSSIEEKQEILEWLNENRTNNK